MSVTYVFDPGGPNELTLNESNLVSHNPVVIHSGKGDLRATFEERRDLEGYAQRQDRLNVKLNGVVKWTGFVVGLQHNQGQATSTVRADGIGKRLEETRPDYESLGGAVTYQSTALHDAIRDYWGRTPFSATVTDQTTETVSNNVTIQSADTTSEWQNITTLDATTPLAAQNGNLELLQTSFTAEGESAAGNYTDQEATEDMSGGDCATVAFSGEYIEYTFTPQTDISASNLGLYLRFYAPTESPAVSMSLNGTTWDAVVDGAIISSLQWEDFTSYAAGTGETYASQGGGDLTAGTTYTWRIEANTDTTTSAGFAVDVIAPLDNQYTYTFDNTNDGSGGYLDGPELYPGRISFELDNAKVAYNIKNGDLVSTWNDTSGGQAVAISNDNGANYISASNTTSVSGTFSTAGRTGRVKFTFDRFGSRTTATPQTGFNGQLAKDFTYTGDLNDLVVIDQLELTRNHFDNLKTLHEYGDFLWVIEHGPEAIGNLTVSSFQRQDETRTSPSEWDVPINERPEVAAESYFNSIYLEGALDDQGNRPTAEKKDQTAINNDGRKISPGVLRDPTITTDAGATFRANALLQTALKNNNLVGSLEAPPTDLIPPGYARGVDFDNDGTEELKTVEQVSLSQSQGEVREVIEFVVREDFARDINELRRNAKQFSNQV